MASSFPFYQLSMTSVIVPSACNMSRKLLHYDSTDVNTFLNDFTSHYRWSWTVLSTPPSIIICLTLHPDLYYSNLLRVQGRLDYNYCKCLLLSYRHLPSTISALLSPPYHLRLTISALPSPRPSSRSLPSPLSTLPSLTLSSPPLPSPLSTYPVFICTIATRTIITFTSLQTGL